MHDSHGLRSGAHGTLTCRTRDDGRVVLEARLSAEQGALLLQALERAAREVRDADDAGRQAGPAGDALFRSTVVRHADALAMLVARFVATSSAADESLDGVDMIDPIKPRRFRGSVARARRRRS
jgi:hypothetical protein